jgi:hypothetical protein
MRLTFEQSVASVAAGLALSVGLITILAVVLSNAGAGLLGRWDAKPLLEVAFTGLVAGRFAAATHLRLLPTAVLVIAAGALCTAIAFSLTPGANVHHPIALLEFAALPGAEAATIGSLTGYLISVLVRGGFAPQSR